MKSSNNKEIKKKRKNRLMDKKDAGPGLKK